MKLYLQNIKLIWQGGENGMDFGIKPDYVCCDSLKFLANLTVLSRFAMRIFAVRLYSVRRLILVSFR